MTSSAVPVCKECGKPMEETSSQNAQITLPDGRRFDCQASPDCSQWAPDGVGSAEAVNLSDLISNHTPDRNDAITLDCEECHLETVFPHEDLTDQTPLICSHCGTDHGTWLSLKEQLTPLLENIAADIGVEEFEGLPGFTPDKIP